MYFALAEPEGNTVTDSIILYICVDYPIDNSINK